MEATMASISCATLILICCGTVLAQDASLSDVIKHVARLESTIALLEQKHADEIVALNGRADGRETELLKRIDDLEKKHAVNIETLEVTTDRRQTELRNKIDALEKKHANEIEWLKESAKHREDELNTRIGPLQERVGRVEKRPDESAEETMTREEETLASAKLSSRNVDTSGQRMLKSKRASSSAYHVAFSSYINHDTDNIGKGETLIFNKILLNDGGHFGQHTGVFTVTIYTAPTSAYHVAFSSYINHDTDNVGKGDTLIFNKILLNDGGHFGQHTGIFTAPMDGVYSFVFFIAQRHIHQSYVSLFQNGVRKVTALAETNSTSMDAQGGNAAILDLEAGNQVYLVNEIGDHVHGSTTFPETTFSGFLVYPRQDVGVVVQGR